MRHAVAQQPFSQDQEIRRHRAKRLRHDRPGAARVRRAHRDDHRLLMHVDACASLNQSLHDLAPTAARRSMAVPILLDVLRATIRGASAPASHSCADFRVPRIGRRLPSRGVTISSFSFTGVYLIHGSLLLQSLYLVAKVSRTALTRFPISNDASNSFPTRIPPGSL